jgi:hypothetical protein
LNAVECAFVRSQNSEAHEPDERTRHPARPTNSTRAHNGAVQPGSALPKTRADDAQAPRARPRTRTRLRPTLALPHILTTSTAWGSLLTAAWSEAHRRTYCSPNRTGPRPPHCRTCWSPQSHRPPHPRCRLGRSPLPHMQGLKTARARARALLTAARTGTLT